MKRQFLWMGTAILLGGTLIRVAGCASETASSPSSEVAAGGVCTPGDTCVSGTVCVSGRCVASPCIDADRDGAGTGPGCTALDCDDMDPTVPADAEACNERDDDCDRGVDEGCPCIVDGNPVPNGSTRPCGVGDCAGVQSCGDGSWTACEGGRTPAVAEECFNGIDDNCDEVEDEGCCPMEEFACPELARCSSNGMCV